MVFCACVFFVVMCVLTLTAAEYSATVKVASYRWTYGGQNCRAPEIEGEFQGDLEVLESISIRLSTTPPHPLPGKGVPPPRRVEFGIQRIASVQGGVHFIFSVT